MTAVTVPAELGLTLTLMTQLIVDHPDDVKLETVQDDAGLLTSGCAYTLMTLASSSANRAARPARYASCSAPIGMKYGVRLALDIEIRS